MEFVLPMQTRLSKHLKWARRLTLVLVFSVSIIFAFSPRSDGRPSSNTGVQHSDERLILKTCHLAEVDLDAKCGNYEVFEDRVSRTGRKISLNIVVVPALSATPFPDPVFWLHGGPGVGSTGMVVAAKNLFLSVLRPDRDLVFVDQRGTGKSNPLKCELGDNPAALQSFFGELPSRDNIRKCREKLEKIADLRLYTTPIAMDDLDEVRDVLGYSKINIVAASYGSIAAQVYMRQHPEHTRAVFLGGVATPGLKLPLPLAKAAQHALELLYEDCAADDVCHSAFPNLRNEFDAVLARFDKGPITVELVNPATKQKEEVQMTRANYVERLRALLYTTNFARFVPLIVHQASVNNFVPFEELAFVNNLGSLLARGMHLTVICSESIPFITEQDIVNETIGTFMGDERVRSQIEACKEWPKGNIPRSYIDPVKSSIPVMMISGEVDGSTPPWLGADAIRYLSNGRQVNIRYAGHQLDSPCIWDILQRFIGKASPSSVDTSCTEKIRRPPFATEVPRQFALQ